MPESLTEVATGGRRPVTVSILDDYFDTLHTLPRFAKLVPFYVNIWNDYGEDVDVLAERLKERDAESERLSEALTDRGVESQRLADSLKERDAECQRASESLKERDLEIRRVSESLSEREAEQALVWGRPGSALPPPDDIPLEDLSVHLLERAPKRLIAEQQVRQPREVQP